MTIQEYLTKMQKVQESVLKYIDEGGLQVINLFNLMKLLDDLKICTNKYELNSVLHLLSSIADNHHRGPDFFPKIGKLLKKLKKEILHYFSNREIFNIFKTNKRVLLLLIENEMLVIDQTITSVITKNNEYTQNGYPEYFFKQIKPFINKKKREELSRKLPFIYEELRKIGENDHFICELIRKDLIDEFISYTNENKIELTAKIYESCFETNQLLMRKNLSLIEYASFFGSIKIIKYLHQKKVELTPNLWIYAIHSNNAELIDFLRENDVNFTGEKYEGCIRESIKCHHNDMIQIIENNYLEKKVKTLDNAELFSLEFYNFKFLKFNSINQSYLYNSCEYDYGFIVNVLFKDMNSDINNKIIFNLDLIPFKIKSFNGIINLMIL